MLRKLLLLLLAAALAALLPLRRRWYARWLGLPAARHRVKVRRNIPIEMPDGVKLLADHYAPVGQGPFPTVLVRSPYGRGLEALPAGLLMIFAAARFAERGYHVVVQGTRGQFDSGGQFEPFIHEHADGLATLDWLRGQPWYDGRLGMWGNSYLGLVQWAIAGDAAPDLRAVVPVTTSANLHELTFADGVFALELSLRWSLVVAGTGSGIVRQRASLWQQLRRNLRVNELTQPGYGAVALRDADTVVLGEPVSFFQRWLKTDGDPNDPYWQAANFKDQLPRTQAAAHLVAGWFDIFLRDQLDDYRVLRESGKHPFLTIGPWGHQDPAVLRLPLREAILWFDAHLRGDPGAARRKPVRYYLMGAETWREADEFPPPAAITEYYLQPGSSLSRQMPEAREAGTTFTFDPAQPTPAVAGVRFSPEAGRADNRTLEARDDVLVFTSEPLEQDLDVIGAVTAVIFVRPDNPNTDIYVRLNDVHPDGQSLNVCDGLRRLTPESPAPRDDGAVEVGVDLWSTAYRFLKGHRLRVLVAGGAHPRWARNPGTGEGQGAATRLVPQTNTILHDADHPSALRLPVSG